MSHELFFLACRAVEIYSPARDVWEPGPPMPPQDAMSFVSGATLGRHLYIVGEAAHVSQRVLALDRTSQNWQSRPFTRIPRAAAAVAAASSTLYVMVGLRSLWTDAEGAAGNHFCIHQLNFRHTQMPADTCAEGSLRFCTAFEHLAYQENRQSCMPIGPPTVKAPL